MTARFITDLGAATPSTLVYEPTGETITLGRYGVWGSAAAHRKAEVIEVGDDLDALQRKYGPNLPIYGLGQGSTSTPHP